jgi:hypothetical protein
MSSLILWTNNASATLASSIASGDTTATLTSGQGAEFPNPGANQYAVLTLEDTSGNIEIVHLTGRNTDVLTIVRAQEGTTAASFASGSRCEIRITAGCLAALLQKTGGDTLTGTTTLSGVLSLGSGGSIQGGEFTGALRSAAGVTTGQITVSGGQPMSGANTILTSANVTSNLPSGTGLAMTGMVVFWAGLSTSVPAGWQICDGTNGTPDLQDTFVFSLSVGSSYPSSNSNPSFATSSTTLSSLTSTGGHALIAAELPSTGYTPTLPFTFINIGQANGGSGTGNVLVTGNTTPSQLPMVGGSNTAHSHTINTANTAHTHTMTPPYQGLFAIMKL